MDRATTKRQSAIRIHTVSGATLTSGGVRITPELRVVTVRWARAAVVWSRPTAVVLDRDGDTQRVPISGASDIVRSALVASAALAWVVARSAPFSRKDKHA